MTSNRRLLNFVAVGGGLTGVEMVGVVWAAGVKASPNAEWLGVERLRFESVDAPSGMLP